MTNGVSPCLMWRELQIQVNGGQALYQRGSLFFESRTLILGWGVRQRQDCRAGSTKSTISSVYAVSPSTMCHLYFHAHIFQHSASNVLRASSSLLTYSFIRGACQLHLCLLCSLSSVPRLHHTFVHVSSNSTGRSSLGLYRLSIRAESSATKFALCCRACSGEPSRHSNDDQSRG